MKRFVSPLEIAEMLGISRSHAYRLVQSLPRVRIGRLVRVPLDDLQRYLARHTERPFVADREQLPARPMSSDDSMPAAMSKRSAEAKPSWLRPLRQKR